MAVYDLEEQEQLDELKTWWKMYGNLVTAVVAAVALAAVSWQGWNWYQRNQAVQAASIYAGIERAASARDVKQVRQLAGELIDKFPRTTYAAMGALLSGKVQVETNDPKNAQAQLQWAADNAKDDALRDLARLRLAAVLLDDKAYDAALKPLSGDVSPAFAARFSELKGDVLASQDKKAEAKTAYEAAMAALEKQEKETSPGQHRAYHDVLQSKLDSLGSAK
ncbi:MAG TPA: tetratricopeptide repeat protein [Rhodocyclaceae bacterium]|jgi:predicted negative regulator of RcsB-dependent stress response